MNATIDLIITLLAVAGVAWSGLRIARGQAQRSLFMTATVGLMCLLVLLFQHVTPAPS